MTLWDEAAQERQRKWLEDNPDYKRDEAIRAAVLDAKLKTNTLEKRRAYQRDWAARNPGYEKRKREENLAKDPDYYNRKRKQYLKNNPGKARGWALKNTYGITLAQWNEMFATQGQCCASCGSVTPHTSLGWNTDHCHTTGNVRGILCYACNLAIGHAKECPARLRACAEYLEKHKTKVA